MNTPSRPHRLRRLVGVVVVVLATVAACVSSTAAAPAQAGAAITVAATQDTYINSLNPTGNYGTATVLKTTVSSASPRLMTFIGFAPVVPPDGKILESAKLVVYPTTKYTGATVSTFDDGDWSATGMTYAYYMGEPIAATTELLRDTSTVAAGSPVVLDVSKVVAGQNPVTRGMVLRRARARTEARGRGHYPAPRAMIDALEKLGKRGFAAAAELEAKRFGELAVSETSHRLVELFVAD